MAKTSSSSCLMLATTMALGVVVLLATPSECARAFFVFGDSLVDNGNNNYLMSTARADSPPYGVDYPTHQATGRFSNGLNIPDIISEHLGAEPTLPYLSPELHGEKLLVGANFASAGVGILNDTGIQFMEMVRMSRQLHYFHEYQGKLRAVVGASEAKQIVNRALVLITLGGNDFVNNYYLIPFSLRSLQFSLPDYVRYLISEYKKILMRLYDMGARRVLVTGTGPLGCAPAQLARSRGGGCNADLMRAAELFNPQLSWVLEELNARYGDGTFIAANTYRIHFDFITDPAAYGFQTAREACCGQGPHNGIGLCTALSNICTDRDQYVFWDAYHPTERANRIIVSQFMTGSLDYVNPLNLSTALHIDIALMD
ncbi:GDSL esterase/lipase LTL1-like [Triticum dicoccoides]|uniref:GDSL esterase/lipase LTL1-like n=1 Tax=Triticum dicoccoides TaxID=85692 RepID=UPI00162B83B9|nr:GDSL esterase/lipase LTL1-like [Triticum dicoccoides]